VGNFLYGRLGYAIALLAVFIVSTLILLKIISSLWSEKANNSY
jgi:hypothetical protein